MIHELVHAFDYCTGYPRARGELETACGELRAFYYSGECNTPVGLGGQLKPGKSPGDCLLEAVLRYFPEPEKIGGFLPDSTEFVCCVWDYCLGCTRLPSLGVFDTPTTIENPKKPKACNNYKGTDCEELLRRKGERIRKWCET
jgi:hypothetical protein